MGTLVNLASGKHWSSYPYAVVPTYTSSDVTGSCTCTVVGDAAYVTGYVTPGLASSDLVAFTGLPAPKVDVYTSVSGYSNTTQAEMKITTGASSLRICASEVPANSYKFGFSYPLLDPTEIEYIVVADSLVTVTYLAGFTCTCTDGTTTLTAGDTSGSYTFKLPNSGTWTFSCTDGTSTYTNSLTTVTGRSYSIVIGIAHIIVTTHENATVSVSLNGEYERQELTSTGTVDFQVNYFGNWTVTSTWDGKTYTDTAYIGAYGDVAYTSFEYKCTVIVKSPASSSLPAYLEITQGQTTYTPTATITSYSFDLPVKGTWSVKCTWDGKDYTDTVEFTDYGDTSGGKKEITFTYNATITVTCPSGSTGYATMSGYSNQNMDTSTHVITVPKTGSWEVYCSCYGETKHQTVNVQTYGGNNPISFTFWDGVLYNYGVEDTAHCGGWMVSDQQVNSEASKKSDHIYLKAWMIYTGEYTTKAKTQTVNAVNLTGFRTLAVDHVQYSTSKSSDKPRIGISTSGVSLSSPNSGWTRYVSGEVSTVTHTTYVDISDITGSYFITILQDRYFGGGPCETNVQKVYLIR